MQTKTYLLVETAVGKTQVVANALRKLQSDGVESVDVVIGVYDIIMVINGPDMSAIGNVITGKIRLVEGVVRTVTCVAITNGRVLEKRT